MMMMDDDNNFLAKKRDDIFPKGSIPPALVTARIRCAFDTSPTLLKLVVHDDFCCSQTMTIYIAHC